MLTIGSNLFILVGLGMRFPKQTIALGLLGGLTYGLIEADVDLISAAAQVIGPLLGAP